MAVRSAQKELKEKKMPRGTQVKRNGLAIIVERRSISSEIVLEHRSPILWLLFWSAKDHTGEETAPIGIGPSGQTPRTIKTDDALGPPTHEFQS